MSAIKLKFRDDTDPDTTLEVQGGLVNDMTAIIVEYDEPDRKTVTQAEDRAWELQFRGEE